MACVNSHIERRAVLGLLTDRSSTSRRISVIISVSVDVLPDAPHVGQHNSTTAWTHRTPLIVGQGFGDPPDT